MIFDMLAEADVIGGLLCDASQLSHVCGFLRPEHFYTPLYADTYALILEGKSLEDVLAGVQGKGHDQRELIDCVNSVISPSMCKGRALQVLEHYKLREAHELCGELDTVPEGVDDKLIGLAEKLTALAANGRKRKTGPLTADIVGVLGRIYQGRDARAVHTGFPMLDAELGWLDPTDFCIIAARPSVGKSAFAAEIALRNAHEKRRVLLVSLEMGRAQIIQRMIANLAGVELSTLRDKPKVAEDHAEAINIAAAKLSELPILIADEGDITTPAQLRAEMAGQRVDLVVIDYIQLMSPGAKGKEMRWEQVETISRELRLLALRTNTPIIGLSQLNRVSEGKSKPTMAELRNSGALEQDACQVILLYRGDANGVVVAEIAKNRQGRTGIVQFDFCGPYMRFTELTDRYEPPPTRKKGLGR